MAEPRELRATRGEQGGPAQCRVRGRECQRTEQCKRERLGGEGRSPPEGPPKLVPLGSSGFRPAPIPRPCGGASTQDAIERERERERACRGVTMFWVLGCMCVPRPERALTNSSSGSSWLSAIRERKPLLGLGYPPRSSASLLAFLSISQDPPRRAILRAILRATLGQRTSNVKFFCDNIEILQEEEGQLSHQQCTSRWRRGSLIYFSRPRLEREEEEVPESIERSTRCP